MVNPLILLVPGTRIELVQRQCSEGLKKLQQYKGGFMWKSTSFPGVRYRNHKSRKHGVKWDRYFAIRYQRDGKRKEEGIGWGSEGWTAEKAALELAELKNAFRTGNGRTRLSERRKDIKKRAAKVKKERISFSEIFTEKYYPQAMTDKDPQTYKRERSLFKKWIKPVVGKLPLKDIVPLNLEKIKKNMKDAGKSARSIQYALAVVRQVFNWSYRNNLFNGDNPVSKVKKPTVDNRRERFLTVDEADLLLNTLKNESAEMWAISLLSLHCGLRASEIFNLTWADIKRAEGLISLKDTKTKNRMAYMTQDVKDMFLARDIGAKSDLLYPSPANGGRRREVPRTFERVVKDIGFNEGITDRRDKVVFHTLRHSLMQAGLFSLERAFMW